MYIHKLPNAAASKITVTSTASTLYSLIDTAAGSAANLAGKLNAVDITVEDGDIRVLFDGNTPTATNGILLSSGNVYRFRGVPLTAMQLIRVSGDVVCSVQVGLSSDNESSSSSAHDVTLEASSVSIGDVVAAGDIAHDATDSGKPVKVGGYAADPTSMPTAVAAADRVNAAYDTQGRQITYPGVYSAGEDVAQGVLKTESRGDTFTTVTSDTQTSTSSGMLRSITFSCNDAAPTAGSIKVYDNTAESGSILYSETFTTTPFRGYTVHLNVPYGTGLYVGFTTTADVNVTLNHRDDV